MTSPSYVYATQVTQGPSPGPSAVIAGNGSYTITTLRGSFLEKGAGYIKAGIDAGTAGRVSGYVDPDGPQGLVEFPGGRLGHDIHRQRRDPQPQLRHSRPRANTRTVSS